MKIYKDNYTQKISFPLGGIGTGAIGLSGSGRLVDWEIFNRPNKLSYNGMSHFVVKAESNGKVIDARVLNGGFQGDLTGESGSFGFGPKRESMAGVPHFRNWEFHGEFPFAKIIFSDEKFPGIVTLTAFNPFIPLNDNDSSIPCAMFDIRIENSSDDEISYTVALVVANPWKQKSQNKFTAQNKSKMITLKNCAVTPDCIEYGDITMATDSREVSYQENWFRGSWFDSLGVYWRELQSTGVFINRSYGIFDDATMPGGITDGSAHAVLAAHLPVVSGTAGSTRMVITWNVPNCHNYWSGNLEDGENCWKNYYATRWTDSQASAGYVLDQWDRLANDSMAFATALNDSTIPEPFIEAAGANISVLKSPTCLRLEDGSFYAFEGCTADAGCCEGSCTHVWNYAYALPYLFPNLERTMRDLDYQYNLKDNGEMPFRLMLPPGRESSYRACADGQFGNIIKVYREWKISGNNAWLKNLWPKVKKSLEYAWHPDNEDRWDPEQCGVLTGRQHHTLDMELFGPNSWLSGFYLAALKAAAEMAEFAGEPADASRYLEIYKKGRATLNNELFNGEYFQQRVDLNNRNILDAYAGSTGCANKKHRQTIFEAYWNDEHREIKYQIGDGCEIDQMLGQWHANLIGLGDIFDHEKAVSALRSIYLYNFKPDMRDYFNPCRLFCLENESGTVMCEWPDGRYKPWVPLTYAEETMHGFEYAAAGQMVQYGMIDEATQIVKAVRDRYNGSNRNPWNEIECGSNYARSMASFAFIPIFSGFKCDMGKGEITYNPVMRGKSFRSFWTAGGAWGIFKVDSTHIELQLLYGGLALKILNLPFWTATAASRSGGKVEFTSRAGRMIFSECLNLRREESLKISGALSVRDKKLFHSQTSNCDPADTFKTLEHKLK